MLRSSSKKLPRLRSSSSKYERVTKEEFVQMLDATNTGIKIAKSSDPIITHVSRIQAQVVASLPNNLTLDVDGVTGKHRNANRLEQECLILLENSKAELGQSGYDEMKHFFEAYEKLKTNMQDLVVFQEEQQVIVKTLGLG